MARRSNSHEVTIGSSQSDEMCCRMSERAKANQCGTRVAVHPKRSTKSMQMAA